MGLFKKSTKQMSVDDLPIPRHLKEILKIDFKQCNNSKVNGEINCICGNNKLQLHHAGSIENDIPILHQISNKTYFIIKATCPECKKEYIVFDKDFHGWDGFICHDESQAKTKRPELKLWECEKCSSNNHILNVEVSSQGKEDFIDETDGQFNIDDWVEGFDWIYMNIECTECGKKSKHWVSYEAM